MKNARIVLIILFSVLLVLLGIHIVAELLTDIVEYDAKQVLIEFMDAIENNKTESIEECIGSKHLIELDDELKYDANFASFFSCFSWRIKDKHSYFDSSVFVATIEIKTKDASVILSDFKERLKAEKDRTDAGNNARLFYDAMNACKDTVKTTTTVSGFKNEDGSWSIYISQNFADVVFGGLVSATK